MGNFLTAPNLISLSRVPLAALVWVRPLDPWAVLSLMLVAGATDVLDGWLERRLRSGRGGAACPGESVGVWLDPLCDKIFVLSVVAAIITAGRAPLFILPLIAAREMIQTLAALAWRLVPAVRSRLMPRFRATALGKATTAAQFCAIAAALAGHPAQLPLAAAAGAMGVATGLRYIVRAWRPGRPEG